MSEAKAQPRLDRETWKRIEVEYRAGVPSTISAKRYGIPASTIYNRASRKGWKRAEGGALIAAAQAEALLQADIEGEVATLVQDTLTVVHRHRSDIREVGTLAMTMLNELRALTLQRDELQALFMAAAKATRGADELDATEAKELLAAFRDLTALPKRIAALAQVTGTMEKLQAMEREAYGLKAAEKPVDPEGDDTIKGLVVAFVDAPYRELD